MKMLVSKMPLVIGEFYETVLKPMALEKGGITAMTIVPLGALAAVSYTHLTLPTIA